MPRYINLVSADLPYTFSTIDSTYSFAVGSVLAQQNKIIHILAYVECVPGIMGLRQCIKTWVTPGNICVPSPPDWDGVDLIVSGKCQNQLPVFTIQNKGLSMSTLRPYKIFIDSVYAWTSNIQLAAGDSILLQVPASITSSARLEIDQSANHPFATFAAAEVSCGNAIFPITYFSPVNETPTESWDCGVVRDSYDPNDKQVQPEGITAQGRVDRGQMFEYKIRFQNTGNDVAYRVVVVDTLSQFLDLSSFEELSASHSYTLLMAGNGKPVLRFSFENINLPDSASNPLGSNGYVRFRIKALDNAPLGSQIRNRAGIYFDFNDPIITNYTINTIYEPVLTAGVIDTVLVLKNQNKLYAKAKIEVIPNPSTGRFELRTDRPSSIVIYSVTGKQLQVGKQVTDRHFFELNGFTKGLYLVEVSTTAGKQVRKVILE